MKHKLIVTYVIEYDGTNLTLEREFESPMSEADVMEKGDAVVAAFEDKGTTIDQSGSGSTYEYDFVDNNLSYMSKDDIDKAKKLGQKFMDALVKALA